RFHQSPAVLAVVEIEHHHRNVLDRDADGVAEDGELQRRHHQREENGHPLATEVRELLQQHRDEPVHAADPAWLACIRARLMMTKTSSSVGATERASALSSPGAIELSSACVGTDSSRSTCSVVPNIVTSRTPANLRARASAAAGCATVSSKRRVPAGVTSGSDFNSSGAPESSSRPL